MQHERATRVEVPNSRIQWIDVGKGLGIVLVTFGHLRNGSGESVWLPALDYTIDTVYLFHMPLFFFLGGFTLNNSKPIRPFLSRKIRTLIVPYYIFSAYFLAKPIATLLAPELSDTFRAESSDLGSVLYEVFIRGNGLWFLWAYFWGELVAYLITKRASSPAARLVIGATLIALYEFAVTLWNVDWIPLQLDRGVSVAGFILLGMSLKDFFFRLTRRQGSVLSLLLLSVFAPSAMYWDRIPMLAFVVMISGVFLVTTLSIVIGKCEVIAYIGRSSLVFYVVNALVLNISKVLFFRAFGIDATESTFVVQLGIGLAITLFSLLLLAVFDRVIRRWFWWSVGASRPAVSS